MRPTHAAFQEAPLPLFTDDEAVDAALPEGRLPSYIRDHRKRLRDRFMEGGAAAMPDYELLELVLFRAIPRQDVKPLARRLIETFGDFSGVLSAPAERLEQVNGVGPAVVLELKIIEAAAHRLARSRVMKRPVLSSWDALLDYCRAAMGHRATEQFRILYLDRKNVLIADEEQAKGTVDHVPVYPREVIKRALELAASSVILVHNHPSGDPTPVYPREVIKRALELSASSVILVHNHPSGDPTPSIADIDMTRKIAEAGEKLGIALHDHVIIGRQGHTSFKGMKLI